MGYTIELSFNLRFHHNVTKMVDEMKIFATNHKCDSCYCYYEVGEKRSSERTHCLITIEFDEEQINNIVQFINDMINNKPQYYIESICRSDSLSEYKIIHASPHYLTLMNREHKQKYREMRKHKSYTKNDYLILKKLLSLPKLTKFSNK